MVKTLVSVKYNGFSVYIHNFSSFDGIFLFKHIANLKLEGFNIKILKRDINFLSITISKNKFKLIIYDSLLLLPSSLNKLATSFGIENKLNFNVIENDNANLNDLNFKENLLKYNQHDSFILYHVILSFFKIIKDLFKIDIISCPTLSSVAFKIYKNKFLKKKIAITWANEYEDFKKAYHGGAVDVYKPQANNIYCYDINSLYPHVMKENKFPIGEHIYFKGEKPLNSIFGIVKAEITCPNTTYAPILLHKINGRTVAPTGSWTGWYATIELENAIKYGYKIKILEGYRWEKSDYIFKGYVDKLYNLRLSYDKNDPKNLICKLLLNSLYGRFGMKTNITEYSIVENFDLNSEFSDLQIFDNVGLLGIDKIKNNYTDYKYKMENKEKTESLLEISTPIAIFTTAYARILMSSYKFKYKDHLVYSDTDSLFLTCELPKSEIGSELGKFKLEYKIKKAVFIAPKVYSLLLEDNSIITKIKGSKNKDISIEAFEILLNSNLNGNNLKLKQEKWFRNIEKTSIRIMESIYTLKTTENKRKFITDDKGIYIETIPFIL